VPWDRFDAWFVGGSTEGTAASMFGDLKIPQFCRWIQSLESQPTLF
jgi:hypothetical protein